MTPGGCETVVTLYACVVMVTTVERVLLGSQEKGMSSTPTPLGDKDTRCMSTPRRANRGDDPHD